jgi:hypothetical protein
VKKAKSTATPRTVKTFDALCEMPRDNIDVGDHWMMISDTDRGFDVTITNQKNGHPSTGTVKLPRAVFAKMVDWFNTGLKVQPRKTRNAPNHRRRRTR